MNSHVFISHSHEDKATADLILHALEKRGVKCWIAPRDVTPGGSYAESILNAIETASCFVLIYSNNSNLSPHVIREVERALNFGVNIIPVRFDQSTPSKSLDYLLATVHWLSISEPVAGEIARAAEQIAAAVAQCQQTKIGPAARAQAPLTAAVIEKPRLGKSILAIGSAVSVLLIALLGIVFFKRAPSVADKNMPQIASSSVAASVEKESGPSATPAREEPVDEMTQQNITDFIKGFAKDISGNDTGRHVAYFANPCRYYSNANASFEDIRHDAEQEIAQFDKRTYLPSPVKVSKLNDNEFRVSFSMIYSYHGNANAHDAGIRNVKMILKPSGTSYLITAISKSDVR